MNPDDFTERALYVLMASEAEARRLSHEFIEVEHIFLGLYTVPRIDASRILNKEVDDHKNKLREMRSFVKILYPTRDIPNKTNLKQGATFKEIVNEVMRLSKFMVNDLDILLVTLKKLEISKSKELVGNDQKYSEIYEEIKKLNDHNE